MTKRHPVFHLGKVRVGGMIKLIASKLDGSSRDLTGWFPNLVLDAGLNRMGTGAFFTHCHVGDASTAPAVTDTALVGFVASTSLLTASNTGAAVAPPYYGYNRKTYRFAAGAAAGNLTEVGFGWGASGAVLFSRSLIKDGVGDPTTITVLSDEFLDVVYELRAYPPLVDTTPVPFVVEGVSHDLSVRSALVTNGTVWYPQDTQVSHALKPGGTPGQEAYSGAIGAITASPSGTGGLRTSVSRAPYGNNDLYIDCTATWELDQGNVGGVLSFLWYSTLGVYQISVDPVLPKDGDRVMTLTMRLSWDRGAP